MSRLASLLIVLLAIAVATPVLAEDRLSLSGQMRVRGWHVDFDGDDNTTTYADQRLRLMGKLSVAEGVSVTFRMDMLEGDWGSGDKSSKLGVNSANITTSSNVEFDRAHLDLKRGMLHLRAGQQYKALGVNGFDAQSNGLALNISGQVPVSLFVFVPDDNGSSADRFWAGANVGHKTDMYAANVFTALDKNSTGNREVYTFGVNYAQNLDMIKLFTEINFFGGETNATTDAYGLQGYVDVSAAVAENVTVGGQFFYAQGDDEDTQIYVLGNEASGWDPLQEVGSGLDTNDISLGRPYVILGNGAGLMGGRIYGSFKLSDDLTLGASGFYGVNDEDSVADYENALVVAAGMKYAFMPKTSLGVQLQYWDFEGEGTNADEEAIAAGMGLFVNF